MSKKELIIDCLKETDQWVVDSDDENEEDTIEANLQDFYSDSVSDQLKTICEYYDSVDDLYFPFVKQLISESDEFKVGDVLLLYTRYESRPHYGLSLVGYNNETNSKELLTDGEGEPVFPVWLKEKLINENMDYSSANNEIKSILMDLYNPNYDPSDEEDDIWCLPQTCSIIHKANN